MIDKAFEIKRPSDYNKPDDYVLVNMHEDIVAENVKERITAMDMCSCAKCFSDACALALNELPPKYVTTRQGKLLTMAFQLRREIADDISVIVTRALHTVKQSPKHE